MNYKVNQGKLLLRTALMLSALLTYLIYKDALLILAGRRIFWSITPLHLLWALLMIEMLLVPIPALNRYVGCGKLFRRHYVPSPIPRLKDVFYQYSFRMKGATVIVLGIWALVVIGIGLLFYSDLIGPAELALITLFLYLCDQICVNIWCPFQSLIIRNKCCNTCRIYNWGHFMMFSPLIFLNNFFSSSLIGLSLLILLQWEYLHHKYPERFSETTNLTLRCSHCKDTICKIKRQLKRSLKTIRAAAAYRTK